MLRCRCGGVIPGGIARCPNCDALSVRPRASTVTAVAVAAQLITACACYGGPTMCRPVMNQGMTINPCTMAADCTTKLADGGRPRSDPSDICFDGSANDGGP